jgi:Putative bacterial sensory transduction regulator
MSTASNVITESRTLAQLLPSVKATAGIREASLEKGGELIVFKFRDKDGDLLIVGLSELDKQRLVVRVAWKVPDNHIIAALVTVNQWNGGESFSHGTFSYWARTPDFKQGIWLESHLLLTGGVTEANIRDWLENFVGHINRWEEVVIAKWKETPADTQIIKNAANPFTEGVMRGAGSAIGHALGNWIGGGGN